MADRMLISAKSVQARLGVGEVTLWRWRKDGEGPRWCKMGSRVMYDLQSVEAFIEARLSGDNGNRDGLTEHAA